MSRPHEIPDGYYIPSWMVKYYGFEKSAFLNFFLTFNRYAINGSWNEEQDRHWFYLDDAVWESELFFANKRTFERYIAFFKQEGILLVRQDKSLHRKNYYSIVLEKLPNQNWRDASRHNVGMGQIRETSTSSEENASKIPTRQPVGMEDDNLSSCSNKDYIYKDINTNTYVAHAPAAPAETAEMKSKGPSKAKPKRESAFTSGGERLWQAFSTAHDKAWERKPALGKRAAKCNKLFEEGGEDVIAAASYYFKIRDKFFIEAAYSFDVFAFSIDKILKLYDAYERPGPRWASQA